MSNEKNNVLSVQDIIASLEEKQKYEEVQLPSRNFLYSDLGLEIDQPIHIRPMTIEEEKILSTPRLVRSGQAIEKIFEACIQEEISPGKLLSPDRIFLLFYIRSISYGTEYDVEIKCPNCSQNFEEPIDLDSLPIEYVEENFKEKLTCKLPDSGYSITYRIPVGDDERALLKHREMMIKGFGANAKDDSLVKRNTMLITSFEGHTGSREIETIVRKLSMKDSGFLRDVFANPGFGINTKVNMTCPFCYHDWNMELPIDANFFSLQTKKA